MMGCDIYWKPVSNESHYVGNGKLRDTFTCAKCHGTFNYINDESWNDEKASQEFVELYPEVKDRAVDVLCDDCNNQFREWFSKLTDEEKAKMRDDYINEV